MAHSHTGTHPHPKQLLHWYFGFVSLRFTFIFVHLFSHTGMRLIHFWCSLSERTYKNSHSKLILIKFSTLLRTQCSVYNQMSDALGVYECVCIFVMLFATANLVIVVFHYSNFLVAIILFLVWHSVCHIRPVLLFSFSRRFYRIEMQSHWTEI